MSRYASLNAEAEPWEIGGIASHQTDLTGQPCDEPGCNCGGIVSTQSGKTGQPAEPWFRAWYRDYAIGVADPTAGLTVGNITGAGLIGPPVKIRPIATESEAR